MPSPGARSEGARLPGVFAALLMAGYIAGLYSADPAGFIDRLAPLAEVVGKAAVETLVASMLGAALAWLAVRSRR
ncbi:hypothetical protein ABZ726_33305 [Streptomyces hundungensis]|uniref:hypothetical protein n=1 Tax=Streptomyces hundungensis TaxID=1077946 RepID=UPI0033D4FBA3